LTASRKLIALSFRAKRGISLWFKFKKREIPRFARNDKKGNFPQTALAVRQHLVDVAGVRRMNLFHFFQAAHPVGLFGAQQVPLTGMHAHHFSRRGDLKPLGGAAMSLELELLYLFCHERFLSEILPSRTVPPRRDCLVLG